MADAYGTHAPDAVRFAYLLTGDADLARDLVQDAFVRIAASWRRPSEPDRFRAYLRRTVANLAKNHYRRRSLERRFLATAVRSSALAPEPEADDELLHLLRDLPVRQRTAVVLRYYLDLSEADAADVMGCSVGAVKSLTARATRRLRSSIEEDRR